MASTDETLVQPLVNTDDMCIIPISLQRDGMQIKPGIVLDQTQGILVGATDVIDVKYVDQHTQPDPQLMKQILVKEADCCCITTLDGILSLPMAADYLGSNVDAHQTAADFIQNAKYVQTCLHCLRTSQISTTSGVLDGDSQCVSICQECKDLGGPCVPCERNGQKYEDVQLCRCANCIRDDKKCIRLCVLMVTIWTQNRRIGLQRLSLSKTRQIKLQIPW